MTSPKSKADAYIDLHSGDGFEKLMPYVYFVGDTNVEEKSEAMAECVNTEWYVRSRCRTGGAYNLASLHGVPSILIERGQLSQMPREQVEQDKAEHNKKRSHDLLWDRRIGCFYASGTEHSLLITALSAFSVLTLHPP